MSNTIDAMIESTAIGVNPQMDYALSMNTTDTTSDNDHSLKLWNAPNALCALDFIIANDIVFQQEHINDNPNELPHFEEQDMADVTQNYMDPQTMLRLIVDFYKQSRTYLRLIGFKNGEVRFLNEFSSSARGALQKQAFIVLNSNGTIRGLLYAPDHAGLKQTIFNCDDMRIEWEVNKCIEKLNQTDPDPVHLPQETLGLNFPLPSEENIETEQRIIRVQSTNQSNELYRTPETDQPSNHLPLSGSTDVSSPTQIPQNNSSQTSTQFPYEAPQIQVHAKPKWKCAYLKDLIPKSRKPVVKKARRKQKKKVNKGGQTKFIGLVQGIGNQRSRPRMNVPPRAERDIHLACEVRTVDNRHHSSKIIVPEKTKVDESEFNNRNDLKCLRFNDCDPHHTMDGDSGVIYMKISAEEHQQEFKEVLVYMFNLYQTARITKEMIKRERLDQCRLAFWFAAKENGNYIRVSKESLSNVISERRK